MQSAYKQKISAGEIKEGLQKIKLAQIEVLSQLRKNTSQSSGRYLQTETLRQQNNVLHQKTKANQQQAEKYIELQKKQIEDQKMNIVTLQRETQTLESKMRKMQDTIKELRLNQEKMAKTILNLQEQLLLAANEKQTLREENSRQFQIAQTDYEKQKQALEVNIRRHRGQTKHWKKLYQSSVRIEHTAKGIQKSSFKVYCPGDLHKILVGLTNIGQAHQNICQILKAELGRIDYQGNGYGQAILQEEDRLQCSLSEIIEVLSGLQMCNCEKESMKLSVSENEQNKMVQEGAFRVKNTQPKDEVICQLRQEIEKLQKRIYAKNQTLAEQEERRKKIQINLKRLQEEINSLNQQKILNEKQHRTLEKLNRELREENETQSLSISKAQRRNLELVAALQKSQTAKVQIQPIERLIQKLHRAQTEIQLSKSQEKKSAQHLNSLTKLLDREMAQKKKLESKIENLQTELRNNWKQIEATRQGYQDKARGNAGLMKQTNKLQQQNWELGQQIKQQGRLITQLQTYYRKSMSFTSQVDHLWQVKEAEYESIHQILRGFHS